jgi:hypothetical protein
VKSSEAFMRRAILITLISALCLAVGILTLCLFATQNEIEATPGSFTIPWPTPTPTPTPTPVPTVTPTSTPGPSTTPAPTTPSGGGGSSQPSISLKLSIDALDQETEWLSSSTGKVLQDVTASSAGSEITLKISRGTFALNPNGEPLRHIYIQYIDFFAKVPPADNQFIYMYELSPEGATFSIPIDITIHYDPTDLPKSPEQLALKIYYFASVQEEWIDIPCLVDTGENTISFSTDHLSIYAFSVVPPSNESPAPQTSQPATTSTSVSYNDWILLILILPAASLAFFIYALIRWRRGNTISEEDEL